ncbi:PIWI domain containing protein [Entamoeba histolytica HM-1:IMSS-B]|uniref:PIWI domain protein n=5 Tax=Entamoeba histolytica TaxID=5759 RepID=C4LVQ2_ENTH1|nr:PIWI domain protein [Entamoeba histolytica HM-1:IMSS]EMD46776.1 PIWI domain containing protein [Entamoeba histolytica KU27]EMH78081.1 PIWI domain containing protein [Entamoeba histolytica HM-1:IMSS-B]ENY63334.1 PIWI domain containing protein [Entamoeba histolytica HM-1:IMSS-A]GAT92755.1 piwi domain protein [Entamoeba histolytica]EAL51050.1 PIWI domain protein [Entamoeba histolytica HM-1:IMSS]|eukprot:XP_656436.1 PIWI domain protein [Entamoeba histolytica HM-1:IMSS]
MLSIYPINNDLNNTIPLLSQNQINILSSLPKKPLYDLYTQQYSFITNYFEIHFSKIHFISYKAKFIPNTLNSSLKRALLIAHFNSIGLHKIITDGCTVSLPEIIIEEHCHFSIHSKNNVVYIVDLIPIQSNVFTTQKANILLKSIFVEDTNSIVSFKKSFYDTSKTIELNTSDGKLKILNGFSSTLRIFGNQTFLVVNSSHKIFQIKTFLQFMENKGVEQIKFEFKPMSLFNSLTKKLVKIDSIDFSKTPLHTFKLKDGKEISFIDYYKSKYGVIIKNTEQPLLVQNNPFFNENNNSNEFSYFIPEFMYMTGLSSKMKSDKKLLVELENIFYKPPNIKLENILSLVSQYICKLPSLNLWNITINPIPLKIMGFRLERPQLIFRDSLLRLSTLKEWKYDIRNKLLYNPVNITKWCALVPTQYLDYFTRFEQILHQFHTKIHIEYTSPKIIKMIGLSLDDYFNEILNYKIVFVVILNDSLYEDIKRKCFDKEIITQCIHPDTLKKQNLFPIVSQITYQIQSKIGGIPWDVLTNNKFIKTMIIGIAVTPYDDNKECISLVSSMKYNSFATRKKYSAIETKGSGNAGYNSQILIQKALDDWYKENLKYPSNIIIYRKANKTSLLKIKEGELNLLKQIINSKSISIKLLYFIVSCRNDIKVFSQNYQSYFNPQPGTIICDTIFEHDNFEFYLISHIPIKGVVRPVLYTSLYNSTEFTQQQIYQITFDLCHLHYSVLSSIYTPAHLFEANELSHVLNKCGYTKTTFTQRFNSKKNQLKRQRFGIEKEQNHDKYSFDKKKLKQMKIEYKITSEEILNSFSTSSDTLLPQMSEDFNNQITQKKPHLSKILLEKEPKKFNTTTHKKKENKRAFSLEEINTVRKGTPISKPEEHSDLSFSYGVMTDESFTDNDYYDISSHPYY